MADAFVPPQVEFDEMLARNANAPASVVVRDEVLGDFGGDQELGGMMDEEEKAESDQDDDAGFENIQQLEPSPARKVESALKSLSDSKQDAMDQLRESEVLMMSYISAPMQEDEIYDYDDDYFRHQESLSQTKGFNYNPEHAPRSKNNQVKRAQKKGKAEEKSLSKEGLYRSSRLDQQNTGTLAKVRGLYESVKTHIGSYLTSAPKPASRMENKSANQPARDSGMGGGPHDLGRGGLGLEKAATSTMATTKGKAGDFKTLSYRDTAVYQSASTNYYHDRNIQSSQNVPGSNKKSAAKIPKNIGVKKSASPKKHSQWASESAPKIVSEQTKQISTLNSEAGSAKQNKGLFAAAMITVASKPTVASTQNPLQITKTSSPGAASLKPAAKKTEVSKKELHSGSGTRQLEIETSKSYSGTKDKKSEEKPKLPSLVHTSSKEVAKEKSTDPLSHTLSKSNSSSKGDHEETTKRKKKIAPRDLEKKQDAANDREEPEALQLNIQDSAATTLNEPAPDTENQASKPEAPPAPANKCELSVTSLPVIIWGPRFDRPRPARRRPHSRINEGYWLCLFLGLLALGTGVVALPPTSLSNTKPEDPAPILTK